MSDQKEPQPIPASLQMASEVEQRLREQQLGVYFVMPRVVRRVLQNELDIASPWQPPPHRKCCVMPRDRLLWLVNRDELGVDERAILPEQIILIAQPEEYQLETMTRDELQRHYWRLMFHARIDFEMAMQVRRDRMPTSELRRRIDVLGQTTFDEIRSVLRAEQMLMRPEDDRNVYAEFVAVYHELQAFSPELVPLYFPSLSVDESVLSVIGVDCDAKKLLQETRPIDLAAEIRAESEAVEFPAQKPVVPASTRVPLPRSARKYAGLLRSAKKLSESHNNVRAALVLQTAIEIVPEESETEARQLMHDEIQKLVSRLQSALKLSDDAVHPWTVMCEQLLPGAQHGFWNANARLLYDLQNVCDDFEHEIYKVDLLRWSFSLGKSPLKRPLPNQRIVLMSKHLRRASLRIPNLEIDPEGRHQLTELLHEAAAAAEHILRDQVEPLIADAIKASGMIPASVVEHVAAKKLVQELADGVVNRGFFTLGDLRDAISRNQLKMPDLNNVSEFFTGDPLLRADKTLAGSLDGVYQRGPFYLRWLQKMNSLAYGIPYGRLLTKFVFLPFGLSFLSLMSIEEIGHLLLGKSNLPHASAAEVMSVDQSDSAPDVHVPVASEVATPAHGHAHLIYSNSRMLLLGCVIFILIHFPSIRRQLVWILKRVWLVLRVLLIDVPRTVIRWTLIDRFLHSFPMLLIRRFVLAPIVATFIFWWLLPQLGFYRQLNQWWGLAVFLFSFILLNSRLGRDTEELTREFFSRTWYRIRVHLVLGLFTLIVDVFGTLMDWLERVLYAVDEWLRFRSGESNFTLCIKAVGGLVWSLVHGVIRFCVTLLIEPQVNPIKHFPVVTVSHKIVLTTLSYPILKLLERIFDPPTAYTITGLILTSIPGAFGFLAWELKENWRLYKANRSKRLKPVLIGHHGETLLRLLCPGLHSGTIPRLFARQRRAARKDVKVLSFNRQAKFAERLHHETIALQHFFERELIALLKESRTFRKLRLEIDEIVLTTNRVLVTIRETTVHTGSLKLEFAEQSGWLIAGVREAGWLTELERDDADTFKAALTGFYRFAAVDLVREQIENQLTRIHVHEPIGGRHADHYDINEHGLVVWPGGNYEREFHYPLDDEQISQPRPRSHARAAGLVPIPMELLVFSVTDLEWEAWQQFWENEQTIASHSTSRFPYQW